jgi:hypothetical protein
LAVSYRTNLYATAGERVLCENGHHVATFNKDVAMGGRIAGALDFIGQPEPTPGSPIPICAQCGAAAFRGVMHAHFTDGWRGSWGKVERQSHAEGGQRVPLAEVSRLRQERRQLRAKVGALEVEVGSLRTMLAEGLRGRQGTGQT